MADRIIDCCSLLNLYAGWGGLETFANSRHSNNNLDNTLNHFTETLQHREFRWPAPLDPRRTSSAQRHILGIVDGYSMSPYTLLAGWYRPEGEIRGVCPTFLKADVECRS